MKSSISVLQIVSVIIDEPLAVGKLWYKMRDGRGDISRVNREYFIMYLAILLLLEIYMGQFNDILAEIYSYLTPNILDALCMKCFINLYILIFFIIQSNIFF